MSTPRIAIVHIWLTFGALLFAQNQPGAAAFIAGKDALSRNDADAAIAAFGTALKANQNNAEYHFQMGTAWSMKAEHGNLFVKAQAATHMREEWEQAVALDPKHYDARESLYQFYRQAPAIMGGSPAKVEAEREAMMHISPYRATLYFSNEDLRARRYQEVISSLGPLVRDNPEHIEPLITLVLAQQDARRFAESWLALDAAAQRFGTAPQLQFLLGRGAALSGERTEQGSAALKALIASTPGSSKIVNLAAVHFRLGMILEHLGAKDAGRSEYEIAVNLAPDNLQMRDALNKIGGR